jgi:hypothetical protein
LGCHIKGRTLIEGGWKEFSYFILWNCEGGRNSLELSEKFVVRNLYLYSSDIIAAIKPRMMRCLIWQKCEMHKTEVHKFLMPDRRGD